MVNEAKKYSVTILGNSYTIRSDESEEHILQSAVLIESYIKEITSKTRSIEQKTVIILVALQLASKFLNMEKAYLEMLQGQENLSLLIERALHSEIQ
ncbi:MAG: cell division protein ZapA [Candidatus Babeliales bacterium]